MLEDLTKYGRIEVGKRNTDTYKVYITDGEKVISPFHDVKLYPVCDDLIINVVNEIPFFSNAKMEIKNKEKMNPIMQDIKDGKLRKVKNIFPSKGYPWNYGAAPQTWESPHHVYADCGKKGDNDPIDIIEIGRKRKKIGEVYKGKILGCLVMIDSDECDYKVLVIDVKDPEAEKFNDIEDVYELRPGLLEVTRHWLKNYKIPDGKKENTFGLEGRFQNSKFASNVIRQGYNKWNEMIRSDCEVRGISKDNALLLSTFTFVRDKFRIKEEECEAEAEDENDNTYFYYSMADL